MNHLLMLNKKANSKVAFCYVPFLNDIYSQKKIKYGRCVGRLAFLH